MHIDPVEQAQRFAAEALAEMARLRVAPSPNHYLIWYSHCSGCYPKLSQRLRAIEAQDEAFAVLRLAELHERFFGTGRQARLLDETCQRIEATMTRLLTEVGGMSRDAGSYGERLETLSSALDAARPIEGLRALIGQVLSETRKMQGRARRIERALADSSQQIEGLRSDLADAQREAHTDGLTGIANRKCFDHEIASAVETARAGNETLSLLLADIDHLSASTTPTATRWPTRYCAWSRRCSPARSRVGTWPRATAARSSPCCCRGRHDSRSAARAPGSRSRERR